MTKTALIIEDEPVQRMMLKRLLENELKLEVIEAHDGNTALKFLESDSAKSLSIVLLDLHLPETDGMSILRRSEKLVEKIPFLVITGSESVEDAVEAMQLGAIDFITKPAQPERLIASVRNALAMRELKEEVKRLQTDRSPVYTLSDVVEITPSLKAIAVLAYKAAASDIPVLITGESGVGKEVIANAIHHEGTRKDKAFVSVNCGALPDNLVESILFGHEKGSFTGATTKTIGKCREADGGVLFLDEVGELKPDAQVKLLRMLQQGEIEPVGSSKAVKVNVRIISATNRSLEDLVAKGRFREDLYYRLNGLPLHIPPLRERRKDIPTLASHLLSRIAHKEGKAHIKLADDAYAWLSSYSWPGNVREMQYVLSRAVLLSDDNDIKASDLANWVRGVTEIKIETKQSGHISNILLEDGKGNLKSLDEIEKEVIEAALARFNGHVGKAAAALNVGQSTLYKRLNKK